MTTRIQHIKKYLLLGILLAIPYVTYKGCEMFPESSFELARDSRLPKWIALLPGLTRADVSLTMNYYAWPWGNRVSFMLRDNKGKLLERITNKMYCGEPFKGYPDYNAITVNGVTDIIEHKKMEPIFYISDDAAVRKQLELMGCH